MLLISERIAKGKPKFPHANIDWSYVLQNVLQQFQATLHTHTYRHRHMCTFRRGGDNERCKFTERCTLSRELSPEDL